MSTSTVLVGAVPLEAGSNDTNHFIAWVFVAPADFGTNVTKPRMYEALFQEGFRATALACAVLLSIFQALVAGTATFKGGPEHYAANIAALKGTD